MMRSRWAALGVAALTSLTLVAPSGTAAARDHHLLDRIDLPDGWRPEGITADRKRLYAGSLADGAIAKINPRNGRVRILAEGVEGRVAVGVDYDRRRDLIWVAGGDTGEIRAHDADTGRVRATYAFPGPARFINDLVVTRRGVYATDSVETNQEFLVVRLPKGRRLPGQHAATTMPLTGELSYVEGFNLNGIVKARKWLLAVQSNTGLLFRINKHNGHTLAVDLLGESVSFGDGLEIKGRTLYVVRNQLNSITTIRLGSRRAGGRVVGETGSSDFDIPTTAALLKGSLYAVNARFNTPPTPTTPYWITRVDAFRR